MQKALTIAAIVIVMLGLAVGIYFLFFSTDSGLVTEDGLPGNNPFGGAGGEVTPDVLPDTVTDTPEDSAEQIAPRLVKIAAKPVARGAVAIIATTTQTVSLATTTATSTPEYLTTVEVRYIDRATGNMYSYAALDGETTRLTNRTIPGIQEASWLPNGSLAYARYISADTGSEHIETYALPADGSDGRFLARDLGTIIPRTDGSVFTFTPSSSGSVGTVEDPDGSGAATLFSSALSSIVLKGDTNFSAHTKPSIELPGYAFVVNGETGAFTKVVGPMAGLSALIDPAGKQVLYSGFTNGALRLALVNASTREVIALPVQTLAEKCVWTRDSLSAYCAVPVSFPIANLPDAWYQGTVSFTDRIWRIDLTARVATLVADLPDLIEDEQIDAVALTLDPNEGTLVFQNKRDGSLWAYSL